MKKIKALLLIILGLFCLNNGIAYAEWQIDYSEFLEWLQTTEGSWAPSASDFGPIKRGHFATKPACDTAREQNMDKATFMHTSCVGYDSPKQGSQAGVKYLGKDSKGRPHWSISGPVNRTPEEEEMVRKARRTRNPRVALEAMKKERQQMQLDKQKEQQSRAEFEQGKKEMLTQLKGGSSEERLNLKGGEVKLALKSGNVPEVGREKVGKAAKDLRNSVYWALKAASAVSNGNNESYETARQYSEYSARAYAGSDIELSSVPDVPAPVYAHPRIRLYKYLIKNTNRAASELKLINTNLNQVKDEKMKSEQKIDQQKAKIKELEQKKSARKENNKREDTDKLIAAAKALLDKAEKQNRTASKKLVSLNEQKKRQEENLSNLRQAFDMVNKHPEQAGRILKKFEGGKQ